MRTTKYAVLGLSILLLFSASAVLIEGTSADSITIDLLDEKGKIVPENEPLIKKELKFETYTEIDENNQEVTKYTLEEETPLTQSTFYLRINASAGTYKVTVSIPEAAATSHIKGSLDEAGLLVKLSNQDQDFVAKLHPANKFICPMLDVQSKEATLLPNTLYKLDIMTELKIDGTDSVEKTPDFTLRFETTPTSGHVIEFYDDLTLIETRIVDDGNPIGELPSPPPREGWNFDGWFDVDGNNITSSTIATKDLRLHTRWSTTPITEYTVAFYDDNRLVDIRTVEYGEPIGELPSVPPREGYDFDGWCDEYGDFVSSSTTVTDDMTLHTEWTKKPAVGYTVDFYDGDELVSTRTVMDGEPIGDLPTPRPRTGWVFDGWFDDSGKEVSSSTIVTSDMSLYTKWSYDPGPEPPQPEGKTIITEETIINDDGSISHITTETTERLDGSDDR